MPFLAPEIPTRIRLELPETHAIALAEGLLAEGVLQEADWQGTVVGSIGAGLTRWVTELLGGGNLARLPIGVFWTDDVRAVSGMEPDLWCQVVPDRDPQAPVGVLGLVSEEWPTDSYPFERDVLVGQTVLEVEGERPGLGFQLLMILQEILAPLACAGCLHWAYREALKLPVMRRQLRQAGLGELSDAEIYALSREQTGRGIVLPGHALSPEAFLVVVPKEAVEGEIRRGVIREARRHQLPAKVAELVGLANEVLDLEKQVQQAARRCDSHVLCDTSLQFLQMPGCAPKQVPFAVRWSADDPLPAVIDDYRHGTRETATNLLWCQGWQSANPGALRKTIRHWRQVTTLVLRACCLAEAMHADSEVSPCL